MKMFSLVLSVLAVLIMAGGASASTAANQGDLLSEFSTVGAAAVAPMSLGELGDIRGEGTFTQTFDFPQLHHDIDQTYTFDTTTIHIVGVASTGQVTLTIDSPHLP
jgi:hypothetical protein